MKRSMSRRQFLKSAVSASGAAALAATRLPVSAARLAQSESTVTVWMPSYGALVDGYMLDAVQRYMAENPGVTVDLQVFSFDAWTQKLNTDIAAGQGPDLALMHGASIAKGMAARGALAAIPESVMSVGQIESMWTPASLATGSWQGQYYFLPSEIAGWSWKANLDLLHAAGVDAVPTTYDEHLAMLDKTTIRDANGALIQSGTGMYGWTYTWFSTNYMSAGGEKLWDVQPDKQVVAFNNERGVASLKAITDLVTERRVWDPDFPPGNDGFSGGKTAAVMLGGWISSLTLNEHPDWNLSAYPFSVGVPEVGPDGAKLFTWPGWGWTVTQPAQDKEAAWAFWSWLHTKPEMLAHSLATGEPSPVASVLESAKATLTEGRPDLVYDFEDVGNAHFEFVWDMQTVEAEMNNARDRIILEGMSPEESLSVAEQAINLALTDAFVSE
jgi:multiple sugar transport system substrate-binding protein